MRMRLNLMLLIAGMLIHTSLAFAEGSITRTVHSGRNGVNRRVRIINPTTATAPAFIGFFQIEADFHCELKIPPTSETVSGQLPNKPSYYFGINGPGRFWNKENPAVDKWEDANNVEVDAGLEYDARPGRLRGWRAFISVNKAQTDYNLIDDVTGEPWRGQHQNYKLRLRVDGDGVPHLRVEGGDAPNGAFEFPWNYNDKPRMGGHSPYESQARRLVGLKRVIANTRPEPTPEEGVAHNWRLDGTRIVCRVSNCRVYSYWHGWPDYPYDEVARNDSPNLRINQAETEYDTPLNGIGSYDLPRSNGQMSAASRRIVDFPELDGATGASGAFPQIFDFGRDDGADSRDATEGTNVSRYTTETVRINLEKTLQARGTTKWRRIGDIP